MPRFTCESCTSVLYSAARPKNLIDPSCPTCGAPFERQREIERWDDEGGNLGAIALARLTERRAVGERNLCLAVERRRLELLADETTGPPARVTMVPTEVG